MGKGFLDVRPSYVAIVVHTSPRARDVKRKHANYILGTLTVSIDEWESLSDATWLKRYMPVLPDLRAALDWAIAEEPQVAIALAGVGWPLWREMSLHAEGRQRLNTIIGLIGPNTPPELETRTRRGLAELCLNTEAVADAYEDLLKAVCLSAADAAQLIAAH